MQIINSHNIRRNAASLLVVSANTRIYSGVSRSVRIVKLFPYSGGCKTVRAPITAKHSLCVVDEFCFFSLGVQDKWEQSCYFRLHNF